MQSDLGKNVYRWVSARIEDVDVQSEYSCGTRDIFQARLEKMAQELIKGGGITENDIYIVSAITGEIGNNSFDHNLGSWPDMAGVFFGYFLENRKLKIVLADRGQGVLATLKRVRPELKNDSEALKTAFTEKVSGRAPENRGNGLKFVKENVEERKMHLIFISGNAKIELNEKMEIKTTDESIRGCLAILSV
ncbi:MAG: hypothetical protein AAB405_01180 [Patescibacteria group bacterium]